MDFEVPYISTEDENSIFSSMNLWKTPCGLSTEGRRQEVIHAEMVRKSHSVGLKRFPWQ